MGDVRENNTASMQKKSLAMNGGNGTNSYSKNSTVQVFLSKFQNP